MGKTLIVYYSKTGNVRLLATKAAQLVEAADVEDLVDQSKWTGFDGFIRRAHHAVVRGDTKLKDVRFDPKNYERVIVFSPLWGPTVCPAIRTYLKRYKDVISALNLVVLGAFSDGSGARMETEGMGFTINGFLALLDKGQTGKETGELQGDNLTKLIGFIETIDSRYE